LPKTLGNDGRITPRRSSDAASSAAVVGKPAAKSRCHKIEAQPMARRSIVLTDRQEAFVSELVRSGKYGNASEVLHEGLRLMERRQSLEAAKLKELRARLDQAERDIADGHVVAYEPGLLDRLDEEIDEGPAEAAAP
jgi:antitoxin ParD1/3/4